MTVKLYFEEIRYDLCSRGDTGDGSHYANLVDGARKTIAESFPQICEEFLRTES